MEDPASGSKGGLGISRPLTGTQDEPKKSRENWRKAKELEEARKAGTAPAEVDEEGKDINPHIPHYIARVPWYVGIDRPTLKHQRPQFDSEKSTRITDEFIKPGVKAISTVTKFRKGACDNCGSMTHKKKDCMERPRKAGAKFTGRNIAGDERITDDQDFNYVGKRDRWKGFDPNEYRAVIDEYAKVEYAKQQLKADKLDVLTSGEVVSEGKKPSVGGDGSDSDEDDDKYADFADMPGAKFDPKRRITVRNLRIREDTAKYLLNLDPNSAYYDPKTRAMRESPYTNLGQTQNEVAFAGENFARATGDAVSMAKTQLFAWEALDKGTDLHLQAEPTKLELMHSQFRVKKDNHTKDIKESILDKYGGKEHLQVPPLALLLAQTEDYVEYSRHGTVIKGQEKAIPKSVYEEDVYISNHTAVWGSYWVDGLWGFKCCHSTMKQSYCTGTAGKVSTQPEALLSLTGTTPEVTSTTTLSSEPIKTLVELHQEIKQNKSEEKTKKKTKKKKRKRRHSKKKSSSSSSSSSSSEDSDTAETKLNKALKREEENRQKADKLLAMDERKRPYNSMYDTKKPTDEDMEAFYLKRARTDDPMAGYL